MKVELQLDEWTSLVRKAAYLQGLILAHEVGTCGSTRPIDEVLYRLAKEVDNERAR